MIPDAWLGLRGLPVESEPGGLINRTFLVGHPPRFVVQRVNPIFGPSVHEDIEAITAHLASQGMVTPRLIRTDSGALFAQDPEGAVWRAMSFIPGRSLDRIDHPGRAEAAGRLVARFHTALNGLNYEYQHVRLGVHDTPRHMERLAAAKKAGPAEGLAEDILRDWQQWSGPPESAPRHAHGDLKLSNLRFSEDGEGLCLLDLDTLGKMSLEVELGDALRSWCNPVGEDSLETYFDRRIFNAAMKGYQEILPLSPEQVDGILAGVERICLELASRFCRDVWEDCYFGWNPQRFESRAAHNLHRARGQHHLALSVRAARR